MSNAREPLERNHNEDVKWLSSNFSWNVCIQNGIYLFRMIEQNIPKHIFVKSQYESVLNQLTCPMFYSYMARVFKVIMIIFRDSVY